MDESTPPNGPLREFPRNDGRTLEPAKNTGGNAGSKTWGPVGAAAVLLLKFFKLGLPLLKTGGTMLLSIWFYALNWGWPFAVGFVVLIFVHECGHLVVARKFGLKVGAPVFIPFMGAVIALKDAPRNAWMEAWVGIGGPLFGTAGAAVCLGIAEFTGLEIFRALAYSGFFLNLFNLTPIGFLDGGRIATALSPWLWVVGLVVLVALVVLHVLQLNFLLVMILVLSVPRLWSLFRARTDEERRYFEVTPQQRSTMAVLYFGLAILLMLGMHLSHIAPA